MPPTEDRGCSHVLISERCVNDCVFCAVADKRADRSVVEREEVLRYLSDSYRLGSRHIVFSGVGEPTLDPNLEEYLGAASALGYRSICLFTNGYELSADKAARWRARGMSKVLVSVHGLERGHDRNVRRRGSFAEATAALDIFRATGVELTVNTCITRHNLEELPELRRLMRDKGVSTHMLSFPEWSGNALRNEPDLVSYEELERDARRLILPQDEITLYDNMPFCILGGAPRRAQKGDQVRVLDGGGINLLPGNRRNALARVCTARSCPLLGHCPGFEAQYVRIRGWEEPEGVAARFLDGLDAGGRASGGRRLEQGGSRPPRPRTAGMSSGPRGEPHRLCVILKPTARCNAGCRYCASHRADPSRDMNLERARTLLGQLAAHARSHGVGALSLLWHGGEPLLMGREFFRAVWSADSLLDGMHVDTTLQSNLLAVDGEWVETFRQHDVRVSSSVDPIDSTLRVLSGGAPQYPVWLEKAALVCEGDVHLGVVFTASSTHAGRAGEVYSFFRNLQSLSKRRIGIRLNPLSPIGRAATGGARSLAPSPEEFGDLLVELWRRWEEDRRPFPFSPFAEWSGRGKTSCTFAGACHRGFLAVDGELRLSNCGRLLDMGRFYGSCGTDGIPALEATELWQSLERREGALLSGACKGCPWWDRCHGGCPTDALVAHGDLSRESPFCAAYRRVFEGMGEVARHG